MGECVPIEIDIATEKLKKSKWEFWLHIYIELRKYKIWYDIDLTLPEVPRSDKIDNSL